MNDYAQGIEEIQKLADELYQGRIERAFTHWSLSCILADLDPSDDDLITHTGIDRTGDLGIDGFWIDETNSRLVFLQGKFQTAATRSLAQEFRQPIQSLLDAEYVRTYGNPNLREFYPDIYETLIDEAFPIQAFLVVRENVPNSVKAWAEGGGSSTWGFDLNGVTVHKDFDLRVLAVEHLISLRRALLNPPTHSPRVKLTVAQTGSQEAFHVVPGQFKTIQATVRARDIVEAYAAYRSAIFRYNPRGPQGSNKVNQEIQATLRDSALKGNFHILNNGLTVVCDAARETPDKQSIEVVDFQIVNGCQTAFTLYSLRDEVDDSVKVTVRIIEGQTWAPLIAKSTNSQTAVRAEQLASLGEEHNRLAGEFDRLDPKWFYERQLGARRFQSAAEAELHRSRYGNRNLTIKEIGQFGAAFTGHPILAKYDLKALFERSDSVGQQLYSNLFGPGARAEQLLFVVLLGRRLANRLREHLRTIAGKQGVTEERTFSELDWLPYAGMHLLALIGERIRAERPAEVEVGRLVSVREAQSRLATLDDWFESVYEQALGAIEFYIEVERAAGRSLNPREFFRSPAHLAKMEERVRR